MSIIYGRPVTFGGGGGLNFKIVGGAAQPTGKENLIWIETETAINQWCFSIGQPETINGAALAVGDVWIEMSANNFAILNALKKNEITLSLDTAWQWDGEAWIGKLGYIYQSGAWEQWSQGLAQLVNYTMLYDGSLRESGATGANVCQDVTGGYTTSQTYSSPYSTNPKTDPGLAYTTYNVDNLYVYNGNGFSTTNGSMTYYWHTKSNNSFNWLDYSTFYYNAKFSTPKNAGGSVGKAYFYFGESDYIQFPSTNMTTKTEGLICDITSFTSNGAFDIVVKTSYGNSNIADTADLTVYTLFVAKHDDISALASAANLSATTISEILENSAALLSSKQAVIFMVKQCTGDFMASAIYSDTFKTALASSPYSSIVYGNEHWAKFLAMVA